jgi:hypothetical protein
MRATLNTRVWDFDIREDGVLVTRPTISLTGAIVTNGSTTFLANTSESQAAYTGSNDLVARVLVPADATEGDTAYRLSSATVAGGVLGAVMDAGWLGSTSSAAAATVFFQEMLLPATVRLLVEVRYQRQPVTLRQVERHGHVFDFLNRPHDRIGGDPEMVYWGFQAVATKTSASATEYRGLGIGIYPVPATAYRLDYSYAPLRADLTSPSDELAGVPDDVVDLIVDLAYYDSKLTGFASGPEEGLAGTRMTLDKSRALHQSRIASSGRQNLLASLDQRPPRRGIWGLIPRDFGSL